MKLLVISNLYPPEVLGGYEILCAQVVDELRARGHHVHVLTTGNGQETGPGVERSLRLERPFSAPFRRSRLTRLGTSRHNAAVTRRALKTVRPERVFVWSQLRLSLGAARAAEASGLPVTYSLNDEHLAGYLPARPVGWLGRLGHLVDRTLARGLTLAALRLEHATCISATLRGRLVAQGLPLTAARVIHQGVPLGRFPAALDRPAGGGALKVLYAGQLHPYKGVHTLLEAAALLAGERDRTTLRLTIAGEGPADYRARLEALAASAGLETAFVGRLAQERLAEAYREHDVLAFTSIWQEPFGLTHLEAMASGTPVVSTLEGGPSEFLEHESNALVFRAGDALDLARQLRRLAGDRALATRLSRAGRALVERRFSLARYVGDLERFLQEAA